MDSSRALAAAFAVGIVAILQLSAIGGFAVGRGVTAPLAGAPAIHTGTSGVLGTAIASLEAGAGPALGSHSTCTTSSASSARCTLPSSTHPLRSAAPTTSAPRAGHPGVSALAPHPGVALPTLAWTNITFPAAFFGGPSVYEAAMAYDPVLQEVVLFGGCGTTQCPTADTWLFTNGFWYNLTSGLGSAPPARFGMMMDWDPALSAIVLFGGQSGSQLLSDTWLFAGAWSNVSIGVGVPGGANAFASMAWDPEENGMVLVNGCFLIGCTTEWSGTWLLNSTGWNVLASGPQGITIGLAYATMAYDQRDGYLLYFGGFDGGSEVNWTYTFSGGVWTNITMNDAGCFFVCFTAPGRWLASMTWDQQQDVIFLTGGGNSTSGAQYNDSWIFGLGTWFPADLFGPREPTAYAPVWGEAMAVNSTGVSPLMVGGLCFTANCFGNNWVWELPPAIANYTVSSNPVTANGPIQVNATGVAGYGSGPEMRYQVMWGNSWYSLAYAADTNLSANWSGSTYPFSYGAHSPPGVYAAQVMPVDFLDVVGPAWSFNVTVNANLTLDMGAVPSQVEVGKVVAFGASAGNGTAPYAFSWQFGDGTTATGAFANHSFSTAGSYQVNVTATDAGAGQNSTNATIQVLPALTATGLATFTSLDVGVTDNFAGTAAGGSGTYPTYTWSFGDSAVAHTASASHAYTTPGTYHVSLTVTDSLGYTAVHNLSVVVNAELAVNPTVTPSSADTGTNVSFVAGASSGTAPYSYTWRFGDGASSSAAAPTHKYTAAGTYIVQLWVNDSGGGSIQKTLSVSVTTPAASGSSSVLGLPVWLWIVLIVILIAAVLGAVLMMRRRRSPPASPAPPPGAMPPSAPPTSGGGPPPGAMG